MTFTRDIFEWEKIKRETAVAGFAQTIVAASNTLGVGGSSILSCALGFSVAFRTKKEGYLPTC